eukprot:8509824-Alexandrium_andersonii.AAC.1
MVTPAGAAGAPKASSMARRQPQASASGDVNTPGRATASDRTGSRPPFRRGGGCLLYTSPSPRD